MINFLYAHWLDIVTTVLGLAYILLEYKASVWMWLVGFLMQALGIVLYYQKGLYADCGMEFYYLAMTVYGYWRWVHSSPESGEVRRGLNKGLAIRHFPKRLILPWLILIAAVWGVIYWLLITVVYLALSFTTGRWDVTWIIWAVSGVLFALIRVVAASFIRTDD